MRTERQGKMDPLLQPGDIVLAIRGTLGKVGMLPPDWQDEELWVANQSCLVLRPARRDVDARLVYLYLRSAIGQAALQSLDCGASTPLVQLSDLKKMPVPVPSPEEAQAMLADFEKELALCARMEELRKEVDLLAGSHWSLNK